MSIKNWDERVFEPEYMVTGAYLLFLAAAYLSYRIPSTGRDLIRSFNGSLSPAAYVYSLLGLVFFIVSVKLGRRISIENGLPILAGVFAATSAVVYLTLSIPVVVALLMGAGYVALLYFLSTQKAVQRLTGVVFALAILSSLSILIHGIPVLSASAREETAVSASRALFHGFAVFTAALLVGFYDRKKAASGVALLAIAGILSGFKSDAIAVIASATIAGLLLKRVSLRTAAIAGGAVIFILTAVSTFIALVTHGTWNIPPYLYIFYRFGFTFTVYSQIVGLAHPFGFLHGQAILNTTQEIVSTTVLGYTKPHIITSTLFGPLTLDFGFIGTILTAVFVGGYLGMMKRGTTLQTCLYAMALTHVLILIEVGLQLSSIMFLLSMLYLSVSGGDH